MAVTFPELGVTFPWFIEPELSWLSYACWIETELDNGIVTHMPLPNHNDDPETLGIHYIDSKKYPAETEKSVNGQSDAKWKQRQQRMANAYYRFNLKGRATRIGYQIPIPKLKMVAGREAVPLSPPLCPGQKARCILLENYNGVPLYYADWSLWYTILEPPKEPIKPPDNLAQHIKVDDALPKNGVQVPVTPTLQTPIARTPPLQTPIARRPS